MKAGEQIKKVSQKLSITDQTLKIQELEAFKTRCENFLKECFSEDIIPLDDSKINFYSQKVSDIIRNLELYKLSNQELTNYIQKEMAINSEQKKYIQLLKATIESKLVEKNGSVFKKYSSNLAKRMR